MPHQVTAKLELNVTLEECLSHVPGISLLEKAVAETIRAGLPVALKGLLSETSTPGKLAEFSCRVTNLRTRVTERKTKYVPPKEPRMK